MLRTVSLALLLTLGAARGQTQTAPAAPVVSTATTPIVLGGAVQTSRSYRLADLRALPSRTRTVSFTSGGQSVTHTSRGVPLSDLLNAVNPKLNAGTRNDALRWAVLARGADGDAALFSRGELDPDFGNCAVLLASEEDGRPLAARDGAGRLVVPGDRKGGRYVGSLVELLVFRTGP